MNQKSLTIEVNIADKVNLYAILACCLIGYRYDLQIFYNFAIGFAVGAAICNGLLIRVDYLIAKRNAEASWKKARETEKELNDKLDKKWRSNERL
jgi:uncharacterized membrane protein YciS (DUF1049 family)